MKISKTRLNVEFMPTNPPRPSAIGVFEGGRLVAMVTLEEFDRCAQELAEMRSAQTPGNGAPDDASD